VKHSDAKQDRKMINKAIKQHESKMHGKTKKMAKGGPTSESMREYGRNMARARNQG